MFYPIPKLRTKIGSTSVEWDQIVGIVRVGPSLRNSFRWRVALQRRNCRYILSQVIFGDIYVNKLYLTVIFPFIIISPDDSEREVSPSYVIVLADDRKSI